MDKVYREIRYILCSLHNSLVNKNNSGYKLTTKRQKFLYVVLFKIKLNKKQASKDLDYIIACLAKHC